jgi:hypothetical protein
MTLAPHCAQPFSQPCQSAHVAWCWPSLRAHNESCGLHAWHLTRHNSLLGCQPSCCGSLLGTVMKVKQDEDALNACCLRLREHSIVWGSFKVCNPIKTAVCTARAQHCRHVVCCCCLLHIMEHMPSKVTVLLPCFANCQRQSHSKVISAFQQCLSALLDIITCQQHGRCSMLATPAGS